MSRGSCPLQRKQQRRVRLKEIECALRADDKEGGSCAGRDVEASGRVGACTVRIRYDSLSDQEGVEFATKQD